MSSCSALACTARAVRTGAYANVSEPEVGPDEEFTVGEFKMKVLSGARSRFVAAWMTAKIGEYTAKELWRENYARQAKTRPRRTPCGRSVRKVRNWRSAQKLRRYAKVLETMPSRLPKRWKASRLTTLQSKAPPAASPRHPHCSALSDELLANRSRGGEGLRLVLCVVGDRQRRRRRRADSRASRELTKGRAVTVRTGHQ